MFTGIIRQLALVTEATPDGDALRFAISPIPASDPTHSPRLGDSIAVNGCCLTIARTPSSGVWAFDVVPETLAKTTLGSLHVGDRVHIEHAATLASRLDGHIVQGHVDGVAHVVSTLPEGGGTRIRFAPAPDLLPYLVPKGSVGLDGVSLTLARVSPAQGWFEVVLIPATLALTTLGTRVPGDRVNLECDAMVKTIVHYLRFFTAPASSPPFAPPHDEID
jgi:riboflavin synthase